MAGNSDTGSAGTAPEHVLETHGWKPDPPDPRDLTIEHPGHQSATVPWEPEVPDPPPPRIDLRKWFPPTINQGKLPICTAATVVGMASYLAKRAHGVDSTISTLFNYRVSRALGGDPDHQGSWLRYAMAAWALCGVIEEQYWPFKADMLDTDPPAFCFAVAQNFRSVCQFRVDHTAPTQEYLDALRKTLARGLPVTLGMHLHPSLVQSFSTGIIPVPGKDEQALGGHAVLLVGYDDDKDVSVPAGTPGAPPEGTHSQPGAFLIRNSWGQDWAEDGYGWLPYGWVLGGLVQDSWTVLKESWTDTSVFADR